MKAVFLLMGKNPNTGDLAKKSMETISASMKKTVEAFAAAGIESEIAYVVDMSEAEMIEVLQGADLAYCGGNPPLTRNVIENCPDLKVIQRPGIGVDSIDLDAATDNGVIVMSTPGYCDEELAVHSAALILANMCSLPFYDRGVREGVWPKARGRMPRRISNLTMGICGLGASGRITAKIWGSGFGTKLIAYDPYVPAETAEALGVTLVDFDTLCRESDLISIHAPLTPETRHIFNAHAFSLMKPNVIIANTSRGPLIDEEALAEALKSHQITAVGLDVMEKEPPAPDNPILKLDDCTVLTPHSAFRGLEASRTQQFLATELPIRTLTNRVLYSRYISNRAVIEKLEGYTVSSELLI